MSSSEQEIQEFKVEAMELLDVAEKSLLALDSGAVFQANFDNVFRSFHNLKGSAGMMDLPKLEAHTHGLENILMPFKKQTSMPKNYISFFLRGIDGARALLDSRDIQFDYKVSDEALVIASPAKNTTPQSIPQSAIDEFIAESLEIIERVSTHLRVIESGLHTAEILNDVYRDVHSLKGSSFLFGYSSIGDLSHAMESSMEPLRNGTHHPSKLLIDGLYKAIECVEKEIDCVKNNSTNPKNRENVPKVAKILTYATATLKPIDFPDENKMPEQLATLTENSLEEPAPAAASPPSAHAEHKESESAASIRAPVSILDNLMTLMGEMVLVRNQVLQFSNNSEDLEFQNMSKRLNGVTSEIQAEMMKTRMQPIGNILTKFHRVVRDLSGELKKNITLSLFGAETELDKTLLEAIKDPLTHIVRNSCDHGIETPEMRKKDGKSESGTIRVKSYHEGGQVVIEVADDGKGLDKDILIKKALEKSLITQAQVATMTENEVFNLIFAPGFSTAAAITNVSGRGVGMDVVRTNIERIGGTVELNSVFRKGTTIRLKIPLTLAIVPALIVRCGKGSFAIPQVKLEELVRVEQASPDNKIEYLHGTPVYRLRGKILPLVDLNKILGFEPRKIGDNAVTNIAVLNADQCSFGLIVDEVHDTADIVVKPLNRLLKALQVYSGATILGDGSIALILDVVGVAKVCHIGSEKTKEEQINLRHATDPRKYDLQDFLIIRLNSPTKHAIVLNYVHRLEELKRTSLEMSGGHPVIRYGKSILPMVSVNEQLGYPVLAAASKKEMISVIVIQKAGVLYGLEVEEIVDTLSTDIEMDTTLVKQAGIFGNLNTPEELIVAIDPFELIGKAYPDSVIDPVIGSTPDVATPVSVLVQNTHQAGNLTQPIFSRKLKILLVEDTVFFRKAVSTVLEKAGHEVSIATDGREALEMLEKNPEKFELIVSDIEMPRMNGFELATAVRTHPSLASLPMLALSSRADRTYSDKGIQAGFNMYLEKLKPEILIGAISTLMGTVKKAA